MLECHTKGRARILLVKYKYCEIVKKDIAKEDYINIWILLSLQQNEKGIFIVSLRPIVSFNFPYITTVTSRFLFTQK